MNIARCGMAALLPSMLLALTVLAGEPEQPAKYTLRYKFPAGRNAPLGSGTPLDGPRNRYR